MTDQDKDNASDPYDDFDDFESLDFDESDLDVGQDDLSLDQDAAIDGSFEHVEPELGGSEALDIAADGFDDPATDIMDDEFSDDAMAFDNAADEDDFSFDDFDEDAEPKSSDFSENGMDPSLAKKEMIKKYGILGGAGLLGVVALGAVGFFLLGGGGGQQAPVQQQSASQQSNAQEESQQIAQNVVQPDSQDPSSSGSLFDDLSALPAPEISQELVRANEERNFDENADIFTLLDSDNNGARTDNGLPMPTPIQNNPLSEGALPGSTNESGQGNAQEDSLFSILDNNSGLDAPTNQNSEFDIVEDNISDPSETTADNTAFAGFPGVSNDVAEDIISMPTEANTQIEAVMPQQTTQPTQVSTDVERRMQNLEDRFDALNARLAEIEDRPSVSQSDISSIQQALSRMEQKMETLQAQPRSTASTSSKASSSSANTQSAAPKVQKASVQRKTKRSKPSLQSSWVLRGAMPGKALIARKGSDSIQTVRIGDSVSGFGTVSAISMDNGRWFVQSSQGRLNQ